MMVVMIHTSMYYVTHGNTVGEHNWMFANMFNSASRVAMPLFMMVSGYLFSVSVRRLKNTCSGWWAVYCFTVR